MVDALAALPERVAIGRIDRLWLFPPRRVGDRESGLVVLSLYTGEDAMTDRREVMTLQYEAQGRRQDRRSDTLAEQGSAPVERIPHVIAGVLRRLGEPETPRSEPIGGDSRRWDALLTDLRDARLDLLNGE